MPETAAPTAATADDHQLASHLAHAAGQRLLQLRRSLGGPDADARVLRDEGDRQANELLLEGLAARLAAGEAVLSEEADDDLVRLEAGRVWIVDPLDGTREFGEPPRPDWAVHVALTAGGIPIAGAVALPALDLVLATDPPPPLPPLLDGPPRIAVSRTRPPEAATRVAEVLDGELVPMGSAGAKAMAVVRGEADAYVHAGGQYEWDSCAPVAVALAAGLHASRLDGSPLRYNNADPYLPDLLICRPELADAAVEAAGTVESSAEASAEAEDGTPWS